jgi:halocyanin-like protein
VLKALGALSTAGMVGLAGCGGNGTSDGDGETLSGSEYPNVDEWMTETDIGGDDDTYDGTIQDRREESSVTIDVGAEGNGDGYAFGPSGVAISAGTEVLWEWTGEGGAHNVEAVPDEQIGESDYEFSSGDAVAGADNEYSFTFDESGIALYHCEPHLSLGMKGSIVVE